jgi:DeoR/GlpR family transcriptional regulator of sugar metabolism
VSIYQIITDSRVPKSDLKALEEAGIEVTIA